MNGSKASSRCNPEVTILPIRKSSKKIEGISVDMPRRPCVETSENGEISSHTHMGKHESTSDELLLLPTNDDSYQTAINRLSHHQKCNPG